MISEILAESDETIAMLLLEKYCDSFNKCYCMQQMLKWKEINLEYTNDDGNIEEFRCWSISGVRRFHSLVQ